MREYRFLSKTHYTNSHALIIGINKYTISPPLFYAVSDAEAVRDALVSEFDFRPENVTCLLDNDATKNNIMSAFLRFTENDIELDDRIVIFFAGHGNTRTGIRGEVGYLVPYDESIDNLSTFIRWDDLTRNADLIRAKHMLFIMDACYGGLALTRSAHPGSSRFLKDMMRRYSRQVLTAGKADELVSDSGGPLPNHSVFTGHLLEGLQGKAETEHGILTASGLMAYVYGKVANDKNSNQTPHYGYFDGDGDFILRVNPLAELEQSEGKDLDRLIAIPFSDEDISSENTSSKVKKVKSLLANDSSSIELHDFAVKEVQRFLSITSEDHFSVQGGFSQKELLERISRYEEVSTDLSLITACMAYWAKPLHKAILQKVLARSTDRLESQGGLIAWTNLRWYPLIIGFYCSGIAACDAKRYDSLASIFYTTLSVSDYEQRTEYFVDAIGNAIPALYRTNIYKQIPGYENLHVPLSEYLFKILQPKLDDILFIGKGYERVFDEFEVLFALAVADIRKQNNRRAWGPPGRFAWKHFNRDNAPLARIIAEANLYRDSWEPIKAGLFGGKYERFSIAAQEFTQEVERLNWG